MLITVLVKDGTKRPDTNCPPCQFRESVTVGCQTFGVPPSLTPDKTSDYVKVTTRTNHFSSNHVLRGGGRRPLWKVLGTTYGL